MKRTCQHCGGTVPESKSRRAIFCSRKCNASAQKEKRKTLADPNAIVHDTARIVADCFYLRDLHDELALLARSPNARRDLAGALRGAILNDAVWPPAGPGRIALILQLMANPSLLDISVRWRHPHEKRTFGVAKRSGVMIGRGMAARIG
jgi:hypothetical protein